MIHFELIFIMYIFKKIFFRKEEAVIIFVLNFTYLLLSSN